MKQKQCLLAISGVKNSGKTTLITGLIPYLTKQGYQVAVIKHDGHDFEPDVPGTDSYRHKQAGAFGTAVFSNNRLQIVKEQRDTNAEELLACFPEADIILLEGFKYSDYPKIELIRGAVSHEGVCRPGTVVAYVTDVAVVGGGNAGDAGVPVFGLDDIGGVSEFICGFI